MSTKLWQPYDEQGRPLPEGANQHEIAVLGKLHGAAHVWLWRKTETSIDVLLQKRSDQKITWPARLDKSAGGHCLFNEPPLTTAIRKSREELGVTLSPTDLHLIGVNRYYQKVASQMTGTEDTDLIENEFQWVFLAADSESPLHPSSKEAQSVIWKNLTEIINDLSDPARRELYVPIPPAYLEMLKQGLAVHSASLATPTAR